jgi:hypothetical protein
MGGAYGVTIDAKKPPLPGGWVGEGVIRRKKPLIMKKAPETGASEWNFALFQGIPKLLLFLRSSFFLRGSLFGCALHRLILPNIKFCDSKKPQCDSYIRLFTMKVKKKMHACSLSIRFRFLLPPIERENRIEALHLDRYSARIYYGRVSFL